MAEQNVFVEAKKFFYPERLFVRVNDKDESKFSIISFQNGESRGFIRLIHIMTWKFDIVITVFNT